MTAPQPDPSPRSGGLRLLRLGSVFGVGVFITPSWLLVAAFVTVSYGGFLRDQIPTSSTVVAYLLALLYAFALAGSVLLHEIGHTAVCRTLGLPVRRIVVFLLGGVSEIDGEPVRPRDEFVVAASGPAVSFLLAGLCFALSLPTDSSTAVGVLLLLLAWSNLVLAVFNILPGLPLDGGRVVQALVWAVTRSRLTGIRVASWCGRGVAGLLALAILAANAVLGDSTRVDLGTVTATALGFGVAAFLWFGAGQTLRAAELGARAADLQLGRLIRPSVYLPAQTPIALAVQRAQEYRALSIVVIDGDGRTRALVDEAELARVQPDRRPWSTLAEVSRALEPGLILAEDLDGAAVLDAVRAHPATEYLIVGRDGISRGVLATVDLARVLGLNHRG